MHPQELHDKIRKAQIDYHERDAPTVSDSQYDSWIREAQDYVRDSDNPVGWRDKLNDVLDTVGGKPARGLHPVEHRTPMLSLDNVFNISDLIKVVRSWGDTSIHVSLKDDGLACSLIYKNYKLVEAGTRGDKRVGESIYHNVQGYPTIPRSMPKFAPKDFEVRGELVMFDDEFLRYNEELIKQGYKAAVNPRNAAAGVARRLKGAKQPGAQLTFIPYSVVVYDTEAAKQFTSHDQMLSFLQTVGFELFWPVGCFAASPSDEELTSLVERYEQIRPTIPFGIDGLVFRVDDLKRCEELGFTSRAPRWAIAYKFPAEEKITTLREIRLQIGRTGNATPVAIFDPIVVGGATVTNASLHNEDHIRRLGVQLGDKVLIRRAGDVVPELVRVYSQGTNRTEWKFPTHCKCGGHLIRRPGEANHRCDNEECYLKIQGAFEHFVSRNALDIEGLGTELIAKLLESRKIRWLPDLFKLTVKDILDVTSDTSKKMAQGIIDSINAARKTTVSRLLISLGIPMAGEGTAKRLHEFFGSFDLIRQAPEALFELVPDVGPKVAQSLATYFEGAQIWLPEFVQNELTLTDEMGPSPDFAKLMEDEKSQIALVKVKKRLSKAIAQDADLEEAAKVIGEMIGKVEALVREYGPKARAVKGNQPLAGNTYVITGNFDGLGSRAELTRTLTDLGAKVTGSVSKNTTVLFQGDEPGANKVDAAIKLGVPIMALSELRELLSKHSQ